MRGWHIKQFLGTGEFTLEFGDYDVELVVPSDHAVAATGELQNPNEVLTAGEQQQLRAAMAAPQPLYVRTADDVKKHELSAASGTKRWRFVAHNVRDFAFASSRSFIWQAWGIELPERDAPVLVMAFFPIEAAPLWDQYAIHATAHAIEVYSRYSVPYPYPVINTINYGSSGGMEYPMITFTAGRVTVDKESGKRTYPRSVKEGVIGVIVHETGHQFFPMTVNSDERQWMWMDEGLNSFLESISLRQWDLNWPQRHRTIAGFMQSENQVPIMTQADQLHSVGANAYGKVTAALTVLREVVMGRDRFDHAFRQYANRWKFKRPMPADFFRSMEDASGVDLDWFWRGWFYSTDHVDLAINTVKKLRINTRDPDREKEWERDQEDLLPTPLSEQRDQDLPKRIDQYRSLLDFYNEHDKFTVTDKDRNEYDDTIQKLKDWQPDLLATDKLFYGIEFENVGGLVMPLPLLIEYEDGSEEELMLAHTIWRRNPHRVRHLLVRDKPIRAVTLDPHRDMYDANYSNNFFPRKIDDGRIDIEDDPSSPDLMLDIETPRNEDSDSKDPQ